MAEPYSIPMLIRTFRDRRQPVSIDNIIIDRPRFPHCAGRVSPESEPGIAALGKVVGTGGEAECCCEPSIHRVHIFRERVPRNNFSLSRRKINTA